MEQRIGVAPLGGGTYRVTLPGPETAARHRVVVTEAIVRELGLGAGDQERLVRASFEFLLEREPAGAIMAAFELDVIGHYFPEYMATMRHRLGRAALAGHRSASERSAGTRSAVAGPARPRGGPAQQGEGPSQEGGGHGRRRPAQPPSST